MSLHNYVTQVFFVFLVVEIECIIRRNKFKKPRQGQTPSTSHHVSAECHPIFNANLKKIDVVFFMFFFSSSVALECRSFAKRSIIRIKSMDMLNRTVRNVTD
jgi:hypothetical protein